MNLVLLAVLVWATIRPMRESLLVAFVAGLLLDLAQGTSLGLSSLIFLIATYILQLYSRKFDPLHPVFLPIFVFRSTIIYQLLASPALSADRPAGELTVNYLVWLEALILALLALLVRPLIKYFSLGFERGGIRLKI